MAIGDVYQVQVVAQGPPGFMMNTLAFNRTLATEPGQADFQTLADAIKEICRTMQSVQVTYRTWRARQVRGASVTWPTGADCNPIGGNLFEGSAGGTTTGTQVDDPLPWQCAMVTTHKTTLVGRRHRGRTYCYGGTEVQQNGGAWLPGIVTSAGTAWATFYTTYAQTAPASGFQFGVWSYRTASGCVQNPSGHGHVRVDSPNAAAAFTPATVAVIRQTVYTQRRRVAGVGI